MFRRAPRALLAKLKVGDKFPEATVFVGSPPAAKTTTELFANKRILLVGLPGAFTGAAGVGGCSKQLPEYAQHADAIKAKLGVAEIFCVASNDIFVQNAWGKEHGVEGKVTMLADPNAALRNATGFALTPDLPILGPNRISRFAMLVDANGTVEKLNDEPDGKGTTCSLAPEWLK